MAETTDVNIIQIETGKSQKSLKSLKDEIKELKNQLINLEEGTDEYNQTLLQLGDTSHQVREIQEQMAQTNQDFGSAVSNSGKVIAGMSGAVGAVTGALSLMGVEMGNDSKLMKILVAAMSITSGIQAIDNGIKAFKALKIAIQASTTATKGLKTAIVSTGIGALVVAIGALVSGLTKMADKQDDVAESSERMAKASEALSAKIKTQNQHIINMAKAAGDSAEQIDEFTLMLEKANYEAKKARFRDLADQWNELTDRQKENNQALKKQMEQANKEYIDASKSYQSAIYTAEENTLARVTEARKKKAEKDKEDAKKSKETYEKRIKDHKAYLDKELQMLNDEIDLAASERKGIEIAVEMNIDMTTIQGQLDSFELESTKIDAEISDLQKKLENQVSTYKGRRDALLAELNLAKGKGDITKAQFEQQLAEFEAKEKEATTGLNTGIQELKKELGEVTMEQQKYAEQLIISKNMNESMVAVAQSNATAEIEYYTKMAELQASYFDTEREQQELEIERNNMLLAQEGQRINNEQIMLDQQLNAKLITEQEYNDAVAQLAVDRINNEAAIAQQAVDIKKREVEQKKKLEMQAISIANTALSQTSQLFSALQQNLDTNTQEGFEQNKKYEKAQATISFLQGLIAAWSSAMQFPMPAAAIIGAASSAMLTGIYAANLSQINSTSLNSGGGSGASTSPAAVSAVSTNVSNVRQTTTASDQIDLANTEQRVVLYMSDLDSKQNERKVILRDTKY